MALYNIPLSILFENIENVDELIKPTLMRKAAVKVRRAFQNKPGSKGERIQAARMGDVEAQKQLMRSEPRLRKYSTMKTTSTGQKKPGLSAKGEDVLTKWDRQRYIKDPMNKLDPFTDPKKSWKSYDNYQMGRSPA